MDQIVADGPMNSGITSSQVSAIRDELGRRDILRMATDIVTAYLENNRVDGEALPRLITDVTGALQTLSTGIAARPPEPAVPVRKSITPEYLVCLEDGRKLKMLKRHLRSAYGMTPDDYRKRWNLPADYPMVAPNYAKRRSEFAKSFGLGKNLGKSPGKK